MFVYAIKEDCEEKCKRNTCIKRHRKICEYGENCKHKSKCEFIHNKKKKMKFVLMKFLRLRKLSMIF